MLNGFVGEYLILLGTYQVHWGWASWAATGVILSACYLLWAYQLVVFAEITLWMGMGSPFFTRRIAAPVATLIEQTKPHFAEEASRPQAIAQPATITMDAPQDSLRRTVSR